MAIKAGQILHVGHDTVVIDRIQTAGPGTLNIPTEKIYELGNYKSVATVRDVPDLTFSMESLDTSCEIEAMLLDVPSSGTVFDLSKAKVLNLASQFKAGQNATSPFNIVDSVALPFLAVESIGYRFGLRDNARQTVGLRGDSIFYNPGSTYVDSAAGSGVAGQVLATTVPAYGTDDGGTFRRILAVVAGQERLTLGKDYTETYAVVTADAAVTTVTLTGSRIVAAADKLRIMYASPTVRAYAQSVHEGVAIKPAAVRGKDIDIYVGGYDPTSAGTILSSQANKWGTVQSVSADYRVTLEKDEEFGNYYATANDYDVPQVNGSIDLKPLSPDEFQARLRRISGVATATRSVGANSTVALPLDIVIKNAAAGNATLKRIHVPDARFSVPGFSGRTENKLTVTLNFESDEGTMIVYKT
jgi:hypothetical protein